MISGLRNALVAEGLSAPGEFARVGENTALAVVASVFGLAIGAQMIFSWQLFKQNGRLLARVSDLEEAAAAGGGATDQLMVGEPAPDFALPDLDGRSVALEDLLARGRGALLFFTDPQCGLCEAVLPAVAAAQTSSVGVPVAVISTGEIAANRSRAEKFGIRQVLLQEGFEVAEQYLVFGSPVAVLLDVEGRIASEPAGGAGAVGELLASLETRVELLTSASDEILIPYREVAAR